MNINPQEFQILLQQIQQKKFWEQYLRLWFKNYNIYKDPYSEYTHIMAKISKDPSLIFRYGQQPFITYMKNYYYQQNIQELRKNNPRTLEMYLVFLEMLPEEIVRLCQKEFQEICSTSHNKFWINYYLRWFTINPFDIGDITYYRKLVEILQEFKKDESLIFRDGSDKYIELYISILDLIDDRTPESLFFDAVEYGRLLWLKWLWRFYGKSIDIHAGEEYPFYSAAENGHLEVLKWLWEISKGTIDIHANKEYAFINAAANGHLKVLEWLWEISKGTIDVHVGEEYAFSVAAENGYLEVLKYLWEISKGTIDLHTDEEYAFRKSAENGYLEILKYLWEISKGTIDLHANNDEAFRKAVLEGHRNVKEYIMSLDPTYDWPERTK